MNLNNLGTGRKLISEVMGKTRNKNVPWSKNWQKQQLDKRKNPHNHKTR
jgi:hypothetical protein